MAQNRVKLAFYTPNGRDSNLAQNIDTLYAIL